MSNMNPARLRAAAPVLLGWLFLFAAARAEPVPLPNGTEIQKVDFERHVTSLLGKLGCNAGSCHGSFQGKGGLYLSLFGYSPAKDYLSLTRDGLGRRINPVHPEQSLILLKPTTQIPHEGGQRFARGSWPYQVVREWIVQGARWNPGSGAVNRVEVFPPEHLFKRPGESIPLTVLVEFADGTRADMTPFCDFRVKDDSIAEISPTGVVRGLRPGTTPVVISYRGNLLTSHVLVPQPKPPRSQTPVWERELYPQIPEVNYIDREAFAQLRQLNLLPSELSGDAEFLRRVTIDTIGCLPTPEEVRAFLADRDPNKRLKKIDALLAHPLRGALWAVKFCDITANNVDVMEDPPELRPKRAKMWHEWFRKRINENLPYDQIVRGVLCATSRDGLEVDRWMKQEIALDEAASQGRMSAYANRPSLDLFWRRLSEDDLFSLEQMAELTAAAFLGVRIECAQCHKHPYDRWTQADYRAFANIFGQTKFGSSPEVRAATARLLENRRRARQSPASRPIPRLREIYVSNQQLRRLPHPQTNGPLKPRALGGPEIELHGDARIQLFHWLVQPDNPFFARSFVNRVWARYFGVGLVEPVDNFSVANPPSNERLLDALARDFIAHDYDIRHLERTILKSRTYQLSSRPNATNRDDRKNYSHAYARRLMAEVVVDVLNSALGSAADLGPQAAPSLRAIEIAANRVSDPNLSHIFRIFGRPARTAACDCERSQEPALPQTLFLMSDQNLLKKIAGGRLKELLDQKKPDDAVIDDLFLATLSRFPQEDEKWSALAHVQASTSRQSAYVDVLWALINTREFILNH